MYCHGYVMYGSQKKKKKEGGGGESGDVVIGLRVGGG